MADAEVPATPNASQRLVTVVRKLVQNFTSNQQLSPQEVQEMEHHLATAQMESDLLAALQAAVNDSNQEVATLKGQVASMGQRLHALETAPAAVTEETLATDLETEAEAELEPETPEPLPPTTDANPGTPGGIAEQLKPEPDAAGNPVLVDPATPDPEPEQPAPEQPAPETPAPDPTQKPADSATSTEQPATTTADPATSDAAGTQPKAPDPIAVLSTDPAHGAVADQPVIITADPETGEVLNTTVESGTVTPGTVTVDESGTPSSTAPDVVLGDTDVAPEGTPHPADPVHVDNPAVTDVSAAPATADAGPQA